MPDMTEQAKASLASRINTYDILASLFLTLPDDDLVAKIRGLHEVEDVDVEDSAANSLLRRYSLACNAKTNAEILRELGIDRANLLRGLREEGPRPPYESLFVNAQAEESNTAVMSDYLKAGLAPLQGIHEPPDYLGVEFNFLATLSRQEYDAWEQGDAPCATRHQRNADDFWRSHPGRWAEQFAAEMKHYAGTDFYRGIAALIADFMREERERLGEGAP
jgi:TorA maturation chaperone TorD